MRLVEMSMRRPLTVIVLIIAVVLASAMALQKMARDIFPTLGVPTIYVAQPYGGMDPAQMEGYLTYYYEYHFLYITGIEHVESKSIQGAALIKLQFYPGTDMNQAMAETVSYVNRARAFMPTGTVAPFVTRFDAGSVPVGNLVFTSESRSVGEMQDAALNKVRPLFATLPGVSAPPPFGGSARTIVLNVKPDKLRAYNISPDDIVSAIASANTISPSGNMTLGDSYPIVPLNSVVQNIQDLGGVPLRTGVFPAVFVRDVATIADASDIVTSYANINGRRTVYVPVTKRADASTLTVVNLVKQNMAKFQAAVPDGITVSYEFDQSPFVTRAIASLTLEGALGALLSGLMVLLFLRDWRSALVVVINIPLSLMGATLALWLTGQTINLMTLGGLALAVGILVDMSTVTVENIHTHLANHKRVALAVADAGREVALPLFISMLCVLAVFIPSLFMEGAGKALFVPLALAVGFSMVAAYLFANTFVPVISTWLIRSHRQQEFATAEHTTSAFNRFRKRYLRSLLPTLNNRLVTVLAYLIVTGLAVALIGGRLGTEIFPKSDAGQLQLRIRGPAGTNVEKTEATAQRVLESIKAAAGPQNVAITLAFVGVHAPNYPINLVYQWNGGPEEGILQVQMKDGAHVNMSALRETLRKQFREELPDVAISFEPADIISRVMSFGANTPIEVAVSGSSLPASRAFAEKIRDKLAGIPALRDLQFGQSLDYPTVKVDMDRERAGLMGVKTADVARSLTAATASSRFTTPIYWADAGSGVAYQIQVQIPKASMNSLEELGNLPIAARGNTSIPLRSVAKISTGTAVGQYERYNMQRMVSVTANIEGGDLGSVAKDVTAALAELGETPTGVSVDLRGQVTPMNQMLGGLRDGLYLAIIVIFLLLAANFQSLRLALIVISSAPAVIAGVALALWVTGTTLNVQSFIGAIMAIGVAVANAILLVTFAERSRIGGMSARDAAADGAQSRLRPILMTSLAMMAGMLPMALGMGESGEQTAPLGRAVIGGLLGATIATLWVLPAVFSLLRNRASTGSRSLDPHDPESGHYASPLTAS
ncbi:MAG: efflux RND transporter permease subunit [Steroidobacteraceae bacterium]